MNNGWIFAKPGCRPVKKGQSGAVQSSFGKYSKRGCPGSSADQRLRGAPLPDPAATHLRKKSKTRCPFAHQPAPLIFFMRNFFRHEKESPAGLQKFSRKTFPDTRPQFQNDFKTFRSEKIPAQHFKKNFPAGSQGKPGTGYPITVSHTQ